MDTRLLQIANTLILKNGDVQGIGLCNGKMGNIIFLYSCTEYLELEKYTEFADNLIDKVYDELNKNTFMPNLEEGLSGIGWAFDYFIRQKLVEADADVLDSLDETIWSRKLILEELIRQNIPLFGELLYIGRHNMQKIIEDETFKNYIKDLLIYYRQLMITMPVDFPVSALNSMLYFVINLPFNDQYCQRIVADITRIITKQLKKGICAADLETFQRFIFIYPEVFSDEFKRLVNNIRVSDLLETTEQQIDYLISSALWNLLYFNNIASETQKTLVDNIITCDYMDQRIAELKLKELSLSGGLTALGMIIIQSQNCEIKK